MGKYTFSTNVLVRTPLLSHQISREPIEASLKRPDFRLALFLASRSLFNEIKKRGFEYTALSEKQKQSLRKYLNRAAFRSTPFGMFSSISLLEWTDCQKDLTLNDPAARIMIDYEILGDIYERRDKRVPFATERFKTNSSLYSTCLDFRYFKKTNSGAQVKFSVNSLEKCTILASLLRFCRTPKTTAEIALFLRSKNVSERESAHFISDLIGEHVIISTISPSITGRDYLEVLANESGDPEIQKVKEVVDTVNSRLVEENNLAYIAESLDRFLHKENSTQYFYSITQREVMHGGLPVYYQHAIEEGLHCLQKLSASFVSKDLQQFKSAFIKKYEEREIPILEALDAQFGIGYGGLDTIRVNYGFSSIGYQPPVDTNPSRNENGLLAWFFSLWKNTSESNPEFEITDEQLRFIQHQVSGDEDSPSISVMFRVLGERVVIESAGGVSALSLIGRFSAFDKVCDHAKHIAQQEQKINSDVIFAEITHLCNLHTANINRRAHFYDYEIPVLTNSLLPENRQIPLRDLTIVVRDNEIILRSKRLNKRVVPRLSSAFNYKRNDLPVFRFLCDLQAQNLKPNIGFSLRSIIPGLRFYPRVRYKSCIIQLAEWHLTTEDILPLFDAGTNGEAFKQFVQEQKLPRYFTFCLGDNFLVIDSEKSEDVKMFLDEIRNKTEITLKEFPFLGATRVSNKEGQPLIPQYIATLLLNDQVYADKPVMPSTNHEAAATNNWVYFKLYCHPLNADIILSKYLFPAIRKMKDKQFLEKWFWIRYNDPQHHLRIRVSTAKTPQNIMKSLVVVMDQVCKDNLASHYQSDVYMRELERYSPQLIEKVEDIFETSSEMVAEQLTNIGEHEYQTPRIIIEAVKASSIILKAFGFNLDQRVMISKHSFDLFFKEFNSSKELKSEMAKLYNQLQPQIEEIESENVPCRNFEPLVDLVKSLVRDHVEKHVVHVSLEKLATDIVHMHLNRLFIYQQRYFEMIHYYLLHRKLVKQVHMFCR